MLPQTSPMCHAAVATLLSANVSGCYGKGMKEIARRIRSWADIDVRAFGWSEYPELTRILSLLPKSSDSMAQSAAYALHTGRRGLWFCQKNDAVALVLVHPNLENALLVMPTAGLSAPSFWQDLCQRLSAMGAEVTLARITPELVGAVEATGAFVAQEETNLDWRFPVTLLDTEKLAGLEGPEFRQMRRSVRSAERSGDLKAVTPSQQEFENLAAATTGMIAGWASTVSEIKDFPTNHLVSSNIAAFEAVKCWRPEIHPQIYTIGNKVFALTLSELPDHSTTANGISKCIDRSHRGISEYVDWHLAKYAHARGYDRCNINGSETASLHLYRQKLRPVAEVPLKTYVLRHD